MPITIRLVGSLKQRLPTPPLFTAPTTVGAVLDALQLPGNVHCIVMVNERVAEDATVLQEGDEVQIVPVIGGGEARCDSPAR